LELCKADSRHFSSSLVDGLLCFVKYGQNKRNEGRDVLQCSGRFSLKRTYPIVFRSETTPRTIRLVLYHPPLILFGKDLPNRLPCRDDPKNIYDLSCTPLQLTSARTYSIVFRSETTPRTYTTCPVLLFNYLRQGLTQSSSVQRRPHGQTRPVPYPPLILFTPTSFVKGRTHGQIPPVLYSSLILFGKD
jgi:hypothetical protein